MHGRACSHDGSLARTSSFAHEPSALTAQWTIAAVLTLPRHMAMGSAGVAGRSSPALVDGYDETADQATVLLMSFILLL